MLLNRNIEHEILFTSQRESFLPHTYNNPQKDGLALPAAPRFTGLGVLGGRETCPWGQSLPKPCCLIS